MTKRWDQLPGHEYFPLPHSAPHEKIQEGPKKCWREGGDVQKDSNSGWRQQVQCVIDSLSRLLLVTFSETSRAPKFETWLWTLIIIKSQTGNFQTMSC